MIGVISSFHTGWCWWIWSICFWH